MTDATLSSGSDEWLTPLPIVTALEKIVRGIALDPCAHPLSLVPARRTFDARRGEDGIRSGIDWGLGAGDIAYVNPPFSDLSSWIAKCATQTFRGGNTILLCPARTDTEAFHSFIAPEAAILAIRGRLRFLQTVEAAIERLDKIKNEKTRAILHAEIEEAIDRGDDLIDSKTASAPYPAILGVFGPRCPEIIAALAPLGSWLK